MTYYLTSTYTQVNIVLPPQCLFTLMHNSL